MEKNLLNGIDPEHSLYVLHLSLNHEANVTVGKLGLFTFPKGTYLYIGSAKRNIKARLQRHLLRDKILRWHIDYLRQFAEISKIDTFDDRFTECELLKSTLKSTNGKLLIKGFGSSDCKCESHLIFVE